MNTNSISEETKSVPTAKKRFAWGRVPEDYEFQKKDIRRNMTCCIMMDAFFAFGFADLHIALFPLLVFLGASNTLIGFINGMNWMTYLGLLISPWISRRFEYKKGYFFATNIPYLLPILIAGLATILSLHFGWSREILLSIVIWSFVFHWVLGGFVCLPHQEYIAACIPATHRATMNGLSVSVGSALGLLSTTAGYFILARISKPAAFGCLFVLTWFITQSGYFASLFAKERRTPVERAPKAWSKEMFQAFWLNKRYVRFVVIWGTHNIFLGVLAWNFVNVYGLKGLHMLPQTAAIMAGIQLVARIVTAGPMGAFIDRIGAKKVFPWLGLAGGLAMLPVVIFQTPMSVYVTIALGVAFYSTFSAACSVIQYGLPEPEHRSGHFTILTMVQVIAMSAGSLLIGKMFDTIGYIPVFIMISVFGIILSPITWLLTRDFPASSREFH